jgi:pimeloyl-ACP methyl ester carboxylesterase
MTTFGLVHGAFHGAWCWERLVPELEARGHWAITVDLPCEDPAAGGEAYARAAAAAFDGADEDLVLVGHSLGGLTIPLVAEQRPVRGLVFLCGLIPRVGRSHDEVFAEDPSIALPGPEDPTYETEDGATHWKADLAETWFFSDCPPDMAAAAAARLRGQFWLVARETSPLKEWPKVPCQYILGTADQVINPEWSRRAAKELLGVEATELDAGHSPFLSRAALLAETLSSAWPAGVSGVVLPEPEGEAHAEPQPEPEAAGAAAPAPEVVAPSGVGAPVEGGAAAQAPVPAQAAEPVPGAAPAEAAPPEEAAPPTEAAPPAEVAVPVGEAAPAPAKRGALAKKATTTKKAAKKAAPAKEAPPAKEVAPAGEAAGAETLPAAPTEAPPAPAEAPEEEPPAAVPMAAAKEPLPPSKPPEEVDEAVLDYLCDSRPDAGDRLAATGLAGLRRVIELLDPEAARQAPPLPRRTDMPGGQEEVDAWTGALWTVCRSVGELFDRYEVPIADAEIRWVAAQEPRAGLSLVRALGKSDVLRARRLCEWMLGLVYLFRVDGRERKIEAWDRMAAERLLRQLDQGAA